MEEFSVMYGVIYGNRHVIALFNSLERAEAYLNKSKCKLFGLSPIIKSFNVRYERCIKQALHERAKTEAEDKEDEVPR